MTRRWTILLTILAATVLAAAAVFAQLSAGTKAPDFTLKDLNGKEFKLSSCFAKPGKVVVLDIWATWCPPCRRSIPHLIDLHDQYSSKGAVVIGVAIDKDKQTVIDFVKQMKMNYKVLHDPQGRSIAELYKVSSIPQIYVIDRKGVIRFVHVGFSGEDEAEQIKSEVKQLLEKK